MKRVLHCLLLAAPLAFFGLTSCGADDTFVGVFESESRENFGSEMPGEYRIEVKAVSKGKYEAQVFRRGQLLETKELVSCAPENDDYLKHRPPGRATSICTDSYGSLDGFLSYSENGISVVALKQKYAEHPNLVREEGLKPGDPQLFEARQHKANYYAHVSWFVYAFRKK